MQASRRFLPAHTPLRLAIALALLVGCGGHAPDDPRPGSAQDLAPEVDPDQLARLHALGYVDVGRPLAPDTEVGVRRLDAERAQPGLNLFTDAKDCSTRLMDLRGVILHTWSSTACHRWDNTVLLPSGDLLVVGRTSQAADSHYLLRQSWDGDLLWQRAIPAHHDVELTPQGRILTLTESVRELVEVDPTIPVLDHHLELLTPDGRLVDRRSLWDLLRAAPELVTIRRVPPRTLDGLRRIDLFHSNSIEWMRHPALAGTHALYGENTVLVSIRRQDLVAIVDWDAQRVIWAWGQGELSGQHDATLLAGGNILIFDNGLGRDWSRVVEVDPRTRTIVWEYRAPDPRSFYSLSRGASQRLGNGNTLITESDRGRVFEVTPAGETVWEFVNPDLTEQREPGVIVRMRRLEGLDYAALLERLRTGEALPAVD